MDAYALELIGDAYALNGNKKQSLNSYKKAFEIYPENTRLKEKLERF